MRARQLGDAALRSGGQRNVQKPGDAARASVLWDDFFDAKALGAQALIASERTEALRCDGAAAESTT
jgi:hypothetical protein